MTQTKHTISNQISFIKKNRISKHSDVYRLFVKSNLIDELDLDVLLDGKLLSEEEEKLLDIKRRSNALTLKLSLAEKTELILNYVRNSFLKKCKLDDRDVLYKLDDNKGWVAIDKIDAIDLKTFVKNVSLTYLIPDAAITVFAKDMMISLRSKSKRNTIQFDDCYFDFEKKKVIKGFMTESLPQYQIHQKVYTAIQNGKPTVESPEMDDFLLHLENGDTKGLQRTKEILSLLFVLDPALKAKHGTILRFYGASGGNGKSVLCNILMNMIGEDYYTTISSNEMSGYNLATLKGKIAMFDTDSSEGYLDNKSCENLKKVATADEFIVRQIRKAPESLRPTVGIIIASNQTFLSSDKTNGLDRRFDHKKIDSMLIRSDEWFDNLKSDNSITYLTQMLCILANDFITGKRTELTAKSDTQLETEVEIKENNNSVLTFIKTYGEENIIRHSVKEVAEAYSEFCIENDFSELGKQKYNATLEYTLKISRKLVPARELIGVAGQLGEYDEDKRIYGWFKKGKQ